MSFFDVPGRRFEVAGALLHALGAPGELRGCSGGVPGTLQGGSGRSRGPLGSLRGRPGHPPRANFWSSEATSETLWEDASKMAAFSAVLASIFRRFWVDSLLAPVLVSFALESLRGKSDTLEIDDLYEGFAIFSYLQGDVTAKRTCRKTCEFRLRTRSAN